MTNYILVLILLIASITDYKHLIVPLWLQVILFLVVFISVPLTNWIIPGILLLCFMLAYKYINKIGGADIKILLILLAYFQSNLIVVLLVASAIGLMYIGIAKINKIPFVPCILVGVVTCLALNNYLMI